MMHPILVKFDSYKSPAQGVKFAHRIGHNMTFTDVVKNARHFQKFTRPNINHSFYFDKQERLCETYCYGFARLTAEDIAGNDWYLEELSENYVTDTESTGMQLAS